MPISPMVLALLLLRSAENKHSTVPPSAPPAKTIPDVTDLDEPLLLDVYLNGQNIGRIGEFVLRGKELFATRDELRSLGFRVQAGLVSRATGFVDTSDTRSKRAQGDDDTAAGLIALATLTGVTWRIDAENQAIYFMAPMERLLVSQVGDEVAGRSPSRDNPDSSTGMSVNYDLNTTLSRGRANASALLDLRHFSTLGVFSSGLLLHTSGLVAGHHTERLDTSYTRVDVRSMRRYVAGDFVSGGLSWSRPVRLEGLQVRTDFSTRPDLITFPLPLLSGSVAVPSAVQVFTGAGQVISSQLAPGPFEIPQVPTTTGAGTVVMTVTDATGQQVRTTQAFYASPALLKPGLQSYSVEFGKTRLNWGLNSNDYGTLAGSGTYRRGITRAFTIEGTTQGTPQGAMAGGGAVVKLGTFAVVNASTAASFGAAGTGTQFAIDLDRQSRFFNFEATALSATSQFRDIASINGDGTIRSQITLSASLSSVRHGAIGLLLAAVKRDMPAMTTIIGLPTWLQSRTAAITYSAQVNRVSLYVNGYADLYNRQGGLLAGVVIPLQKRASINLSMASVSSQNTTGQVMLTKSASDIGEWGYQVYADKSAAPHQFAEIEHRTQRGFVSAGLDRTNGITTIGSTASGSVSLIDHGVFVSNRIQDSFAVVDTNGVADVRVLDEERVVARSDRHGRALVPDLRAFQANHLAIDTDDVPLDVGIQDAARVIRPQDRSGVVIRFRTAESHSALLIFADATGAFLPVGSIARLLPSGEDTTVGYDGEAYLQNLGQTNRVRVIYPDGLACTADFRYVHLPGTLPTIGPVPCR